MGYTRFVYKGSHVSFETDSVGTMGLRYTWGAGTDDLVAITTAAGAHYYVTTDRLGSVRSIAKRDGTWQLSQRFDPYGRLLSRDADSLSTIGAQLRYGWTGREYDAETGFSFHRARFFDPESRRWTQEDPIGYAGGMNVYAYVGGSPMEATDPSGLLTSLDRSFAPFCTWGGSCVNSLGNVTRHGQQYAIDGVMIGHGGMGGWAGGVVGVRVAGSTFAIGDVVTLRERNATGNIVFEDESARDAFLKLRNAAFDSGDLVLIEMTTAAAHLGIRITGGYDELLYKEGCYFTCAIKKERRVHAQISFAFQEALPIPGVRAEVLMAHELGHLVGMPRGMANPVVAPRGETYDGLFHENHARALFGCQPRNDYSLIPSC